MSWLVIKRRNWNSQMEDMHKAKGLSGKENEVSKHSPHTLPATPHMFTSLEGS